MEFVGVASACMRMIHACRRSLITASRISGTDSAPIPLAASIISNPVICVYAFVRYRTAEYRGGKLDCSIDARGCMSGASGIPRVSLIFFRLIFFFERGAFLPREEGRRLCSGNFSRTDVVQIRIFEIDTIFFENTVLYAVVNGNKRGNSLTCFGW